MKVALVGTGRMGREVERLATEAGHEIVVRLDETSNQDGAGMTGTLFATADVAIDFSVPSAVLPNLRAAAEAGVATVIGTTGWERDRDAARAVVSERGIGCVVGSNFSIGAHLFARVVAEAARLFDRFPDYDPYVLEHHHRGKQDAPSGTALRLAEAVQAAVQRKTHLQCGHPAGAIAADALQVVSVRAGTVFGRHEVGFDSAADTITLVHTAKGREGFARGALLAAEWVQGRRGFFDFTDIFSE